MKQPNEQEMRTAFGLYSDFVADCKAVGDEKAMDILVDYLCRDKEQLKIFSLIAMTTIADKMDILKAGEFGK